MSEDKINIDNKNYFYDKEILETQINKGEFIISSKKNYSIDKEYN